MTNLLCLVGLHARIRIMEPRQPVLICSTSLYRCRRCTGRWNKIFINLGQDSGVMWERIS